MKVCTVDGCDTPAKALGMCSLHYRHDLARRKGPCTVEGCDRYQRAKGWCEGHYDRWKRHGEVRADVPLGTTGTLNPEPCGTVASYGRGCRCSACRKANAARKRGEYQRRMVVAWPVIRHVDRLVAGGMTLAEVARKADLPYPTVRDVMHGGRKHIHAHTAESLREVEARPTTCVDCDGQPMPGGAERCLPCFQQWVAVRRKRRQQIARRAGLVSTGQVAS